MRILEKALMGAAVFAFGAGVALGLIWAIWLLWCWVLPQLWQDGPPALIAPSYWLFAGVWFLLGIVRSRIFPSAKAG